jgi:hypothetical protein
LGIITIRIVGILTAPYRYRRSFELKIPVKIKKTALAKMAYSEEMET